MATETVPSGLSTSDATSSGLDTLELDTLELDALEFGGRPGRAGRGRRLWSATWPKVVALALVILTWQILIWTQWRPPWAFPSPAEVFEQLGAFLKTGVFWDGAYTTVRRGVTGYLVAVALGFVVGIAVARNRILRAGIGSLITGLQTMPSIAWFPLAILLFRGESAIMFVIVLGAAPSIANGVIGGVDYVPPLLLRAGRNIGATGWRLYAFVIAPASLPAIVAGLKQGWAFAWRSLLAGELLVFIGNTHSLGAQMEVLRNLNDAVGVMAVMIAIFVVGVIVDGIFGRLNRFVRRRWGVLEPT